MTDKNTNRILYLDYARAIAIFLVVYGHILEVSQFQADHVIHQWIYAFHMPFFFFASGYSYGIHSKPSSTSFINFVKKKFISIYLPYLLWGCIFASCGIWEKLPLLIWGSYHSIAGTGTVTPLWYLPCFFVASIGFYFIKKVCSTEHRTVLMLIAGTLLFIIGAWSAQFGDNLPFNFNVAVMGCAFMCYGYVTVPVLKKCTTPLKLFCLLILSLAGSMLFLVNIPESSEYVIMAKANYGNPFLFLITALSGILMLLGLGMLIERLIMQRGKCSQVLCYVGRNTLVVLCVHKSIVWLLPRFERLFSLIPLAAALALSIAVLVISLVVGELAIILCPALIGKISAKQNGVFHCLQSRIQDRNSKNCKSKETQK